MGNEHLAPQTPVLHCKSPCEDAVQVLQGLSNPLIADGNSLS